MPRLVERLGAFRRETPESKERVAAWSMPLRAMVVALELEAARSGIKRMRPLLKLLLAAANPAARLRRWHDLDLALQELAASQDLRGSADCLLWLGSLRHLLREKAQSALEEFETAQGRLQERRWKKLQLECEFLAPALSPPSPGSE
jgi:hypothetical protein